MKFVWQTVIREVKDHTPVLSGRKDKESGESIFTFGRKMRRIITADNIGFEFEGDEVPPVGTAVRITVETL